METLPLKIAKSRTLKKVLGRWLPEILPVEIVQDFHLCVDSSDMRGPSFYVLYGGGAAFYHYEEREKSEILQALPPDGVFIDVGANIGLFSFFVSRMYPKSMIVAVEPHPKLAECISQTVQMNEIRNVIPVAACLGATESEPLLHVNRSDSGGHSLIQSQLGKSDLSGEIRVQQKTLDSLVVEADLKRVDVVKIDVQGAEWELLKGAKQVLNHHRPTVMLEVDNDDLVSGRKSLSSHFGDHYRVRRIHDEHGVPVSEAASLAEADMKDGRLQTNFLT